MDMGTYETVTLDAELIGDNKDYLVEGMTDRDPFHRRQPCHRRCSCRCRTRLLPISSDGIKGDTANNPTKPATLATGLVVQVPLFVQTGRQAQDQHRRAVSYSGRAN